MVKTTIKSESPIIMIKVLLSTEDEFYIILAASLALYRAISNGNLIPYELPATIQL